MLAIPQTTRPAATVQRLVFGLALYEFLLLSVGLVLGLSHHLTTQSYGAVTWSAAAVLLLQAWRNGFPPLPPVLRWFRTGRGKAALLLAAVLAVAFALQLTFDALYGTQHYDGLWYHIPRVMFWLQQRSFDPWNTPVWAQIGLPVGADVILGQKILLGTGWRGVGYVSGLLSLGAIASVYLAALDLRLSRWQAAMTAILFGSFPAIGLRIWSVNSDIAAAFPVLASYVALHRVREAKLGLAIFLVLNAVAIACKPTVAPHAVLLALIALWQCREKILTLRSAALPFAAVVLGTIIVFSSYWPVYLAFSDFQGGNAGRAHKVASAAEVTHAVALSTGHWLLEPLGYLPKSMRTLANEEVTHVYNQLGARIEVLPESWRPFPTQDAGRTGLAAVVMLPLLLLGLSSRARLAATLLFLLGFVSLSGMVHFQAWNTRYTVVLLAGYALLWGATRLFLRGKRRWLLAGLVALNVCSLVGVVCISIYWARTSNSSPGDNYNYLAEEDRGTISGTLSGRPLLVIKDESLEALLAGPDISFPLSYLTCPADGDWERELRNAALTSNWLAVVHNNQKSMQAGPDFNRPGFITCSEVSTRYLEDALTRAGWHLYRHNRIIDFWRFL